ncbi:hypothetical protein HMPREF1986_00487 [Oribacterium sp. oral taxon 078 str. F0263]|nr:hypothetical protein HMPREF1986_00487 [Oribacterium sp. oral taxon 078 str. F0263]
MSKLEFRSQKPLSMPDRICLLRVKSGMKSWENAGRGQLPGSRRAGACGIIILLPGQYKPMFLKIPVILGEY